MVKTEQEHKKAKIWELLEAVPDPEIPVLSVVDLGIVREVQVLGSEIKLTITPTYSGCPAMNTIAEDIKEKLISEGYQQLSIETRLSPAWTTDWLSPAGKEKLEAYGIAPPVEDEQDAHALFGKDTKVCCPLCKSANTKLISPFGSTPCKAFYQCQDCLEPFDYFKCLK